MPGHGRDRLLAPHRRDQVTTLSLSAAGWDDHPVLVALDNRLMPLHWLGFYHDLLIARTAATRAWILIEEMMRR